MAGEKVPLGLVEIHGVEGISVWTDQLLDEGMIQGTSDEMIEERVDVTTAVTRDGTTGGMIEETSEGTILGGDVVHREDGKRVS